MESIDKAMVIIFTTIVLAVFATITVIGVANNITKQKAIKAGLYETVKDGQKIWVKCDELTRTS